jgi:thiamine pyrophosphokinase
MQRRDYSPYDFFESHHSLTYGIIVLNHCLSSLRNLLTRTLWNRAVCCACADGGANLLKAFSDESNDAFLPNYISGDFDSIHALTNDYYRTYPQIEFISTYDQNATDFTKCVRIMMDKHVQLDNLLVFCSLGGRFDHTTGIIHSLFLLNTSFPHLQIYLCTEHDLTFLLHSQHENRIHLQSKYNGHVCSLLPFGCSAHVKTHGLKWNLDPSQELSFNKLISSSNSYETTATSHVDVSTDQDIIWTMTYRV